MTDHTDLIKRLRACETEYSDGQPVGYGAPFNPDGPEAADALEAKDRENERLREALSEIQIQGESGVGSGPWCGERARAALAPPQE